MGRFRPSVIGAVGSGSGGDTDADAAVACLEKADGPSVYLKFHRIS